MSRAIVDGLRVKNKVATNERKLSPERVQRRDSMKARVLDAYQYKKLQVIFTVEQQNSPRHFGSALAGKVFINPRKPMVDIVNTLVHEAIHCLEDWHHNRVYAVEKDICEVLQPTERQHLLLWALDNGFWRDC